MTLKLIIRDLVSRFPNFFSSQIKNTIFYEQMLIFNSCYRSSCRNA